MVRITDYKKIIKDGGREFCMLVLQGGIESLISSSTGKIYFTMRKVNVSTTFDEETCKSHIGTELEGVIQKRTCEPYEYTIPETGEILTLHYNWQYIDPNIINPNINLINEELVN